jgi:3'-phosphoadenosine 5'-phosphosulfate sulfotransferase (PAPS reductase)/FAD synthetase
MNPYIIKEPTCISFSGGRTSAYMLYKILEAHDMSLPSDAYVCFANTGKEEEATLRFIDRCSKEWNVDIHWLEYTNDEPNFKRVTFETANRTGKPFEELVSRRKYLPNPVTRYCTSQLKIRVINQYLRSIGWEDHSENEDWMGIRADEPRRVAKIKDKSRVPLAVMGITSADIHNFWKNNNFDLELPIINGKTMHGNCDLCFLKPLAQIVSLIQEKPEKAIWWAKMEKLGSEISSNPSGAVFRQDRPNYASMLQFTKDQQMMFDVNEEAIACFCGD